MQTLISVKYFQWIEYENIIYDSVKNDNDGVKEDNENDNAGDNA